MTLTRSNELTPYTSGWHCIFYALQDACNHFDGTGLTPDSRDKLKASISRREHLFSVVSGNSEMAPGYLSPTLQVMLPELDDLGIGVRSVVCRRETMEKIVKHKVLKRYELPYKLAEESGSAKLEFPFVAISSYRGDDAVGHVWFAKDLDDYNAKLPIHMPKGSKLAMVLTLQKKQEN